MFPISGFAPNGTETTEDCPVCREPSIVVEHGHKFLVHENGYHEATTIPQHYSHCPECGSSIATVCYDCKHCKAIKGTIPTK